MQLVILLSFSPDMMAIMFFITHYVKCKNQALLRIVLISSYIAQKPAVQNFRKRETNWR